MRFELALSISSTGVDVFDVHSGTCLRSINIADMSGQVCAVGDGDMILTQANKPLLQFWCWKTGQLQLKCSLAERLEVVAVSPDSNYFVGGTEAGKLYIWDLVSGKMLNCFQAHYKKITALSFTNDGSFLITGGEDAVVNAWLFDASVLNVTAEPPSPYADWSTHSLPITQIHTTVGGHSGRVLTCSLDRTCKLWDIPSKTMIFSCQFPAAVTGCVMDPSESYIYAACTDNNIYQLHLLGGEEGTHEASAAFQGHTKAITSISMSYNGSTLLSASEDESVRVWDTNTKQVLRVLKKANRGTVQTVLVVQDTNGFMGRKQQTRSTKQSVRTDGVLWVQLQKHLDATEDNKDNETPMAVQLKGTQTSEVDEQCERSAKRCKSSPLDVGWSSYFVDKQADVQTELTQQLEKTQTLTHELERWKEVSTKLQTFCADLLTKEVEKQ